MSPMEKTSKKRALTGREREILNVLAEGMDTDERRRLSISRVTVRNHVQRILHKLDLTAGSKRWRARDGRDCFGRDCFARILATDPIEVSAIADANASLIPERAFCDNQRRSPSKEFMTMGNARKSHDGRVAFLPETGKLLRAAGEAVWHC